MTRWALCLLLLWSCTLLPACKAKSKPGNYTREDLLVAFPTHLGNAPLISASRLWRQGVRTHIVVTPGLDVDSLRILAGPQPETYTVLPDFPGHPNTVRHALTPIYAMDVVGPDQFSWMLLGDDDTIWVIPAVLRMLNEANISADDPHLINDYQYRCSDPVNTASCEPYHAVDPRCLPCPADGPKACPCKLPRECMQPDPWQYSECSLKARVLPYGGVGVIMSVGLLRLLTAAPFFFPYALKSVSPREPWGDRVLADAPRLFGYGFTQLGDAAMYNRTDPDKSRPFMGTYSFFNDERSMRNMLAAIQWAAKHELALLRRTVSLHARAHLQGSYRGLNGVEQLLYYSRTVDLLMRIHEHEWPHE